MGLSHFSDRLFSAVQAKNSVVVVGMDPDLSLIPRSFFPGQGGQPSTREKLAKGVTHFAAEILDAVADLVVAVKPQLAYFERLGPPGLAAFEDVVKMASAHGLLVIADGKRNDIASTARQYAGAYLGLAADDDSWIRHIDSEGPKADGLTVNPYLGWDGIEPFLDPTGEKGVFVLVKTSNPSSGQLQDVYVAEKSDEHEQATTVAQTVAQWIETYSRHNPGKHGYGTVGAVVGATYPDQLIAMRAAMPHVPFLIPGYGAQGGSAADVAGGFDKRGLGAVVNASRSILYAYRKDGDKNVALAARDAARRMRDDLRRALESKQRASAKG